MWDLESQDRLGLFGHYHHHQVEVLCLRPSCVACVVYQALKGMRTEGLPGQWESEQSWLGCSLLGAGLCQPSGDLPGGSHAMRDRPGLGTPP